MMSTVMTREEHLALIRLRERQRDRAITAGDHARAELITADIEYARKRFDFSGS